MRLPSPAGLPFGPFDPLAHRTFEIGLRAFVEAQAGLAVGYVEQLYTFGDRGRHAQAADTGPHMVSVGYLALTRMPDNAAPLRAAGAGDNGQRHDLDAVVRRGDLLIDEGLDILVIDVLLAVGERLEAHEGVLERIVAELVAELLQLLALLRRQDGEDLLVVLRHRGTRLAAHPLDSRALVGAQAELLRHHRGVRVFHIAGSL